jgi:hypothetical protein
MSDEDAIKATLEAFPTIPGAEGLRAVLAYEAAHQHQLQSRQPLLWTRAFLSKSQLVLRAMTFKACAS